MPRAPVRRRGPRPPHGASSPRSAHETVPLAEAAGRVLAEDVVATRAQPPFAASAMDGYAVRAADAGAGSRLRVIGTAAAGGRFAGVVGPGEAVRIFTGAPVPDGADLIVIQEDVDRDEAAGAITVREGRDRDPHPPGRRRLRRRRPRRRPAPARRRRPRPPRRDGRRPRHGRPPSGRRADRRPATSSSCPATTAGPDQILASNNFGLKAMRRRAPAARRRLLPIARDTPESLAAALDLAAGADLVVTLGGASVGDLDLVRGTAVARGLDLAFYRIAMRPGKPLLAGRLGTTPMIGLPGNPVSALVCAHLFLRPAIDADARPPRRSAGAATAPASASRSRRTARAPTTCARASAAGDGGWRCTPFSRQDSSLVSILAEANGLLVRPPRDPARAEGDLVEFMWLLLNL